MIIAVVREEECEFKFFGIIKWFHLQRILILFDFLGISRDNFYMFAFLVQIYACGTVLLKNYGLPDYKCAYLCFSFCGYFLKKDALGRTK